MRKSDIIALVLIGLLAALLGYFIFQKCQESPTESPSETGVYQNEELKKGGFNKDEESAIKQFEETQKSVEGLDQSSVDSFEPYRIPKTLPTYEEAAGENRYLGSESQKIARLVEGSMLLEERIVIEDSVEKLVRVYDVADRFKYSKVRVETKTLPNGEESSVAMVADHMIVKASKSDNLETLKEKFKAPEYEVTAMHTPQHFLISSNSEKISEIDKSQHLKKALEPIVEVAESDYIVFEVGVTPDDPRFDRLWGMHNSGSASNADIDAPEVWEIATGSREIKVGVIDTGVDYNHPDLAANMWTNPGEIAGDGIDNDNNGFIDDIHGWDFAYGDSDPMDGGGHGTHCAGTIGGVGDNGVGVAGVNWNVSIVALKFLSDSGSGSSSDAIDAINYAVRMELNLTSNSWGGGGNSQLMKDAIRRAGEANQLFVAAAGNSSANMEQRSFYPAGYSFESAIDNIVSVASLDSLDRLSSFSNFGAISADLGAPGTGIHSTVPGGGYDTYSGTSMAAPHVAGALALYLSLTRADFAKAKEDLLASVVEIPALEGRCVTNGRLNVFNLVLNSNVPYVNVISETITGSEGDSLIHSPGETLSIRLEFENIGLETAADLVAEMSTTNTDVELLVDHIEIGNLEGRETIHPEAVFQVHIPETMEVPEEFQIDFEIRGSDANSWSHRITIKLFEEMTHTRRIHSLQDIPLEGVEVEYVAYYHQEIKGVTVTDAKGEFSFQGIDGYYLLTLRKTGFLSIYEGLMPGVDVDKPYTMRAPKLEYDSDHIVIEVREGETADTVFEFRNVGDSYLEHQVGMGDPGRKVLSAPFENTVEHTISDSFSWKDISATGYPINLDDDTVSDTVSLGFNFFLYNKDYNNLKIGSNGLLLFGDDTNPYVNTPLSNSYCPNEVFAYFWSDLVFGGSTGRAYYKRESGKITFQFDDVCFYFFGNDRMSAQVILKDDNSIEVNYKNLTNPSIGTVGLKGLGTDEVYQVSYEQNILSSRSSLLIKQHNGEFGYVHSRGLGVLQAGESERVPIFVSAKDLPPGVYMDSFNIIGSWADYDGPEVITVELRVLEAPKYKTHELFINDSMGEGSSRPNGDGDGVVEPGETIELKLSLENIGSQDSSDLLAELASDSPHVSVLQLDSSFDSIGVGSTQICERPFLIKINESTPFDVPIPMYLKLLNDAHQTKTVYFELNVAYNKDLKGRVTEYETGMGLSGVRIISDNREVVTDFRGDYSIGFSRPGTYNLRAFKDNYASVEESFEIPSDTELNLVLKNPQIKPEVEALEFILYQGELLEGEIEISNRGHGDLDWEIASSKKWVKSGGYHLNLNAPYVWDDISSKGQHIAMGDDVVSGPIALPQNFNFYQKSFDKVYVSSNGFISFDPDFYSRALSHPMDSSRTGSNKLAFFWKDLVLDIWGAGRCHTFSEVDGTFVVQFSDALEFSSSHRVSVQARLKPDGTILMYYNKINNPQHTRIGLKGENNDEVVDIGLNSPSLSEGAAFEFERIDFDLGQWQGLMSGTISKEPARLRYVINTSDIEVGNYEHHIKIKSNDTHGNHILNIPVRITVYQNEVYENFMQDHQIPSGERGILEDHDDDGFNNLEEFAFGLDPERRESRSLLRILDVAPDDAVISASQTTDHMEFVYRRRTDDCGLSYELQCSQDLKAWSPANVVTENTSSAGMLNIEKVEVSIPKDPDHANCYYRVKVTPVTD